jgi:hypothetical protein
MIACKSRRKNERKGKTVVGVENAWKTSACGESIKYAETEMNGCC